MTEQNGSKVPIEHTRIQVILCRNNHRILRLPNKSNQFTTRVTLQSRSLRAIWIGILSVWMMMVIPWLTRTGQLWYLFHETDRWTRLKQVRCQLGHKVTGRSKKLARFCHCTRLLQTRVITVRKKLFAKRRLRRDRNVRTPFREKTKEHGTERTTGAELWKRTNCYRCQQLGHMAMFYTSYTGTQP